MALGAPLLKLEIKIMAMNIYENTPLDFRVESRFVKRPGETRNFNWSLVWSFTTKDQAVSMIETLRNSEYATREDIDTPVEEYRLTVADHSFTNN